MREYVVQIEKLTRRFGRKTALNDVSMEIPRGVVFGLIGENGAGKTTLLKHILGQYRAQSGFVRVFGFDPVEAPKQVLGQIGYLSEDRALPGWMTVRQLISYTRGFYPAWDDRFAEQLRDLFELPRGARVSTLSRGQMARVGLLVACAHRPPLLVLDEPSSGLDPIVRRDILGEIIRVIADEGRTVLFSSHLLDEVQRVADEIAMLCAGENLFSGNLDETLASHGRWVAQFPQDVTERDFSAAMQAKGEGRDWVLLCNGKQEILERQVRDLGGEIIEISQPTLEDIFVARTAMGVTSHE